MHAIEAVVETDGPLEKDVLLRLARQEIRRYGDVDWTESVQVALRQLWAKLIESSLARNVDEKYLTAACNCVSVYLKIVSASASQPLRNLATSSQCWSQAFDCAQYAFACGNTKPALQVLETIAHILNGHPNKQTASDILHDTSKSMLAIVISGEPRGNLKAACITLSCFIKRTELPKSLSSLVQDCVNQAGLLWLRRRVSRGMGFVNTDPSADLEDLILALLFAIENLESRSAALKLLSQVCGIESSSVSSIATQAAQVLQNYIRDNQETLTDFAANVFPVILSTEKEFRVFEAAYSPSTQGSASNISLYLTVLKVGRLKEYITIEDLPAVLERGLGGCRGGDCFANSYASFDGLLTASDALIRIRAYDLLTASFATRVAIPLATLDCIHANFTVMHNDNDAFERGELMSISRRFFGRLDSSNSHLKKLHAAGQATKEDDERGLGYESFITRLADKLTHELDTGVSYQRHITALGYVQLLSKTAFETIINEPVLKQRLKILMLDPYDDVRAIAAAILTNTISLKDDTIPSIDERFLDSVLKLATDTCRNDHADAAARTMVLHDAALSTDTNQHRHDLIVPASSTLVTLHDHLLTVKTLSPANGFPLHSFILAQAQKYALVSPALETVDMALICCRTIWQLVQPILCVDSPETGTEDHDGLFPGGPKDLLAYSWRALRDSSLLLQALMSADDKNLVSIGSLCLEQLVLLRHRGAFSTVAQTFALCCDKARASRNPEVQGLVRQWYAVAVTQIDAQASKVTRRSAGLPAIFNGVLPPNATDFFNEAILTLMKLAEEQTSPGAAHVVIDSLPQVHALNCIKDIVTNSKFRSATESFIFELIELAAKTMSSPIWAIRNCGLMLLRACMNRLSSKMFSSAHARTSDRSDPGTVALNLLRSVEGFASAETGERERSEVVFASLGLVRHLDAPLDQDDPFGDLIRCHISNGLWAIRKHAARVLAERVASALDWDKALQKYSILPESTENEAHGLLLFFGNILDHALIQPDQKTLAATAQIHTKLARQLLLRSQHRSTSPFVQAAYMDVVVGIVCFAVQQTDLVIEIDELLVEVYALLSSWTIDHLITSQRVLLFELLCSVLDSGQDDAYTPSSMTSDLSAMPDDGLEYIAGKIEELASRSNSAAQLRRLWPILLGLLIRRKVSPPPSMLSAMASILEYSGTNITCADADALMQRLADNAAHGSRDDWNAEIRLRAHALKALLRAQNLSWLTELRSWLGDIATAGREETEFPTRINAAQALSITLESEAGLPGGALLQDPASAIKLLVILYDQLNDDDEEIRSVAEQSAAKLLRESSPTQIPPCAFLARQIILDQLKFQQLIDQHLLHEEVIWRLVGSRALDESYSDAMADAVETRLQRILASMNDLFAEERQNLYIDILNDITLWGGVLERCTIEDSSDLWQSTATWILEGLKASRTALHKASQNTGFHLTWNFDILELFTRVLVLAQVFGKLDGEEAKGQSDWNVPVRTNIAKEHGELLVALRDSGAHPSLLDFDLLSSPDS